MKPALLAAILILSALASPAVCEEPAAESKAPASHAAQTEKVPDRAQLEKEFEKTMSGCTLVGYFTVEGRGTGEPKEERYTIKRVTKQQGDTWLFLATMQFSGREVTIPMPIPVKWAGDTAVISVTDLGFPGMGTYTARVLIYRGQYAGTWSAKDHGGHLWGRIERADKDDAGADSTSEPAEKKPGAGK